MFFKNIKISFAILLNSSLTESPVLSFIHEALSLYLWNFIQIFCNLSFVYEFARLNWSNILYQILWDYVLFLFVWVDPFAITNALFLFLFFYFFAPSGESKRAAELFEQKCFFTFLRPQASVRDSWSYSSRKWIKMSLPLKKFH